MKNIKKNTEFPAITGFASAKQKLINAKMAEDTEKAEAALTPEQKKQRDENSAKAMAAMEENMKKMQKPSTTANPVKP